MKYLEILKNINYWGILKENLGKPRDTYVDWLIDQKDNKNISAVIGVRRSGKSTILRQVLFKLINDFEVKPENTLYVNFEDPRLVELLIDNQLFNLIEEFNEICDRRSKIFIVFDEIQNVENWEAIIRTLLDQYTNIKLYITGSSASLLGKELGTKLSGRYVKTEVFPFSFLEFKEFVNRKPLDYITLGGFPDSVLTKNKEISIQLLRDYYESILLRDITARYGIRNEAKLRRLSTQLFSNIANQASSYRLAKDLELSADTILQYFAYIEDAFLGFFIPKYSVSLRKQEYNPKKFYAIDNGLQSAISFKVMDDIGKLFENTVFLELRRKYSEIFYWQEKKEVDFLIKKGEEFRHIVNVSVSIKEESTRNREIESLKEAMFELKYDKSTLIILNGEEETIETEFGKIEVIKFENMDKLLSD